LIFGGSISNAYWPKGCIQSFNEGWWNSDPTGGVTINFTPICERTHTLLIRQTITTGMWPTDVLEMNSEDPDADNYAILNQLEQFRSNDGKFYFKLTWPNADEDVTYEWSQNSNPLLEDVAGYEPIHVPFTGRGWGGLEPSHMGLMDGAVLGTYKGNWFYSVGAYDTNTIPGDLLPAYAKGDNDYGYWQTQVELYVQKKNDASCYVEYATKYLSGYPASATKCNPGSCSLGEAKAYCDTLSDCGGVTLDKNGLYTVRAGTVLKTSPTGETTWTKVGCEAAERRRLDAKEFSTLKNRLINLQN